MPDEETPMPAADRAAAGPAAGAAGAEKRSAPRRPRSRRGEGERLRADIVAAACRILDESGEVGELSLRAVARAVGVATTSIYLHFREIDELVLAVKVRYFQEFGEVLDAAARDAGGDPRARVRAQAHRYVHYGLDNRGRYRAMFSSLTLPRHLIPDAVYVGEEVFDAVRAEIAAGLPADRDANLVAIHFWTALHGIVMLRTTRDHFPWPDLDRQIDDLIDLLLPAS